MDTPKNLTCLCGGEVLNKYDLSSNQNQKLFEKGGYLGSLAMKLTRQTINKTNKQTNNL